MEGVCGISKGVKPSWECNDTSVDGSVAVMLCRRLVLVRCMILAGRAPGPTSLLVDMNDDTYVIVQVRGRSSKGYLVEFDDRVEEVDFSSLLVFDGILQDENVIGSMLSMVSGGVEPGSPVVLNRSGMFALIFHNYSQN